MLNFVLATMLQAGVIAAEPTGTPAQPLSYTEAFAAAEQDNKPLVVMIGADWCPGCVQMKKVSIPQVAQDNVFGEVAFTMVDTDRQADIARQIMDPGSIPQLIMYRKTDNGWTRERLNGGNSPSAIISFLRRGVQAAGRIVK